jgi:hypothetical protein
MLKIKCDKCKKELMEAGALVFSPPRKEHESGKCGMDITDKFHICTKCWDDLELFLNDEF